MINIIEKITINPNVIKKTEKPKFWSVIDSNIPVSFFPELLLFLLSKSSE